jgi:aspartate 1-decarboxylase
VKTYVAAKLHGLVVTSAEIEYSGSATIDGALLDAAGIEPYQEVQVIDLQNANRWTTYALAGAPGEFQLNGGAALLGQVGDRCIVIAYQMTERFEGAKVLFLESNKVARVIEYPPAT